jgi:hypothetical protein
MGVFQASRAFGNFPAGAGNFQMSNKFRLARSRKRKRERGSIRELLERPALSFCKDAENLRACTHLKGHWHAMRAEIEVSGEINEH